MHKFRLRNTKSYPEIDPDVIFLDSHNLPEFNTQQFEGRIERPISRVSFAAVFFVFVLLSVVYVWKVSALQIKKGAEYFAASKDNQLRHIPIFAPRGVIYDRNQIALAFNGETRSYIQENGFGHLLGYVGLPSEKDLKDNNYYSNEIVGRQGLERTYEELLRGTHGLKIEEVDVHGNITSSSVLREAGAGVNVTTSIDARVQKKLYSLIESLALEKDFQGGAGIVMDIKTGELIALVSYPEYSPAVLVEGKDTETISAYQNDSRKPFLNRATQGLYAPGSIVKPFIAAAALNEHTISPDTVIVSTGSISIPNPYDPSKPSVFKDWKAHGGVTMRQALAVSSDVYFYVVGGGYHNQAGLGIARIDAYLKKFGFGSPTGIDAAKEAEGVIPTPEWKAENFNGEKWNIGNTYHTAIGQYGFQVTPIQTVRAIAAIANGGKLVTPRLYRNETSAGNSGVSIGIPDQFLQIVREGMRMSVTEGTASGLSISGFPIAAKTGTAELGVTKEKVNSWVIGFFPYETPRYAFAVVMERGDVHNTIGGVYVMRQLFDWMLVSTPEYTRSSAVVD